MLAACASAIASHAWRTHSTTSPAGSARAPRARREIASLEVLHHHVRRAVFEHADIDHARDVLSLDLGSRARLASEPLDDLWMLPRFLEEQT